jgi:hypothetical protein
VRRQGNVDLADLRAKCEQHRDRLAAVMITYPSTYGVFEPQVKALCALVHEHGGRVYVDGANMNALVGVAAPGEFGGDVSHLNLHKTFCIPHGGGGPGVGPVCVVADLVPFLPARHGAAGSERAGGPVGQRAAGQCRGAADQLDVHAHDGRRGPAHATETAILSANYVAARLADHYDIHFSGGIAGIKGGGVAHECILDLRPLKESSGVSAEDVAKRLIDYGFHAPTLSFPVAGTLMVEPTESEPLAELDRFCDAMIAIRGEIAPVERGEWPQGRQPAEARAAHRRRAAGRDWPHPYSREQAAYPVRGLRAAQVLGAGGPRRQRLGRPQPQLQLPAAVGLHLTPKQWPSPSSTCSRSASARAAATPSARCVRRGCSRCGCSTTACCRACSACKADLYGSLGATGKGHGSDKAVLLGLLGHEPDTVDVEAIPALLKAVRDSGRLKLAGAQAIEFAEKRDLVFHRRESLPLHANGMRFAGLRRRGRRVAVARVLLGGRRFRAQRRGRRRRRQSKVADTTVLPLPFHSGEELLAITQREGLSIAGVMRATSACWRTATPRSTPACCASGR